jgi:hypothetical protein
MEQRAVDLDVGVPGMAIMSNALPDAARSEAAGPPEMRKATSLGAFPQNAQAPTRIVVLHLDSLCCLPAMNVLFKNLQNRVVLVVSSDRFAGIGDFIRQLRRNVRTSGIRMTVVLGFDIVALRIFGAFARLMRALAGARTGGSGAAPRYWQTPQELAGEVGAEYRSVHDVNSKTSIDLILSVQPDLLISFHFDQILRPSLLKAVSCSILNVHPALLPAHRGPCPSFWALAAGDELCGVTVHQIVDEAIDAGPVVARRQRDLPALCMAELDELLFLDGADLLGRLLGKQPQVVLDPPGGPDSYESFPVRAQVGETRRRGVRLWRLAHAARLIAGLFGWRQAADEGR